MIFAELHGKLGHDYSLAHDRAEDLLTSTVFQLLRYLPITDGFLPLLRKARSAGGERLSFEDTDAVELELWPRLGVGCCPDVLLKLIRGSNVSHAVVIEAKLFAGKTGRGIDAGPEDQLLKTDDADAEESEPIAPDQL